jgi:hypothetical protein
LNLNKILILTIGFTALAGLALHQGNGNRLPDVDESMLVGTVLDDSSKVVREDQNIPAHNPSEQEDCLSTPEVANPDSVNQQDCSSAPTSQAQTEKTPEENTG